MQNPREKIQIALPQKIDKNTEFQSIFWKVWRQKLKYDDFETYEKKIVSLSSHLSHNFYWVTIDKTLTLI